MNPNILNDAKYITSILNNTYKNIITFLPEKSEYDSTFGLSGLFHEFKFDSENDENFIINKIIITNYTNYNSNNIMHSIRVSFIDRYDVICFINNWYPIRINNKSMDGCIQSIIDKINLALQKV